MLTIGQPLPEFSGQASLPNGEFADISLRDYRGKWLVLFFYPLDFTFVCPTEIRGFNEYVKEFAAAGAAVLGASIDSVHSHKAWTEHGLSEVEFPLIGDLTRQLATDCGVLAPEGFAQRATFIANPRGLIESITVNSSNVGRSPEETLRVLQALQAGGLAPCSWQPGEKLLTRRESGLVSGIMRADRLRHATGGSLYSPHKRERFAFSLDAINENSYH